MLRQITFEPQHVRSHLKYLDVTCIVLRRISEIKIPSPSNCVSFLKFGDSRQEITLGKKIIVISVGGFKLRS